MKSHHKLLFIVLYIIPLSGVGTDLYSPSLPAIVHDLLTTTTLVKMTVALYLFGFSIGQFVYGTFSDIHGRKIVLLISLATFSAASYLAAKTNDIHVLLMLRCIQGFCAAGPSVIAKALLTDTLTGTELKKASIYMVTVWGLSPIIAPAIGGYLQHYFGWHANFYFFALYSFSMVLVVAFILRETNLNLHPANIRKILKNYQSIFMNPVFLANTLCMGLAFSNIMVFNIFMPFLVQNVLSYSAITYGHCAMIVGIAFLIGPLSNRWLMAHVNTTHLNRIGTLSILAIAAVMLLSAYFVTMTLFSLIVPIFFIIMIGGLLQTNFMTHNLSLFPHIGGSASAAVGGILCLVAALVSTSSSYIEHASNSITLSWVYLLIALVYSATYWFIIDKVRCQKT